MHRAAQRKNDIVDVAGNVDGFTGLHIGRKRGAGTESSKCGDGRLENVLQHDLDALFAVGKERIQWEEHDGVNDAQRIVDQHTAAVIAQQLRAELADEVCEVSTQTNGSQLHTSEMSVPHREPTMGLVDSAGFRQSHIQTEPYRRYTHP